MCLLNATPRGSECRYLLGVRSGPSIGGTSCPSLRAVNSVIVSVTSSVRKSVVSLPPISVIVSVTGSVRNSVVSCARNSVTNSVKKNVKDLV